MIPSQVHVGREEKEEKFLSPNACFDSGPQLANTVNEIEFFAIFKQYFGATHDQYKFSQE